MTEYPQGNAEIAAAISRIEAELAELQLASFTADDARRLGMILVELAEERRLPVAIEIARGEHLLFHVAMPGATPDNTDWIRRKSAAVRRYTVPSLLVGLRPRLGGRRIEDDPWFDERRMAAAGGSFPIQVRGVGMVGTVTVSGLPQMDDHLLVVEALRRCLAETRAHGRVGHADSLR